MLNEKSYKNIRSLLKGKRANFISTFLILASIGAIYALSFNSMKPYTIFFNIVIYCASAIFLFEYVARIVLAPLNTPQKTKKGARLHYIFSFYGLVDFVATLPVILTSFLHGTEYREALALPFIFVIFKLIRHSKSLQLISSVLKLVKEELITAYTACTIFILFSSILMYFIERDAQPEAFQNIGDGMWWAVITFATVGYGDIYPITALGQFLGSIVSIIGVAMIAIPSGIVTAAFINKHKMRGEENRIEDGEV